MWAHADYYGISTNMKDETLAILQGVQISFEEGFRHIGIEVDSSVLVQVISNIIDPLGLFAMI